MNEQKMVDEKLRQGICDAKVVSGVFDGSDHYAVLDKIKVSSRWE